MDLPPPAHSPRSINWHRLLQNGLKILSCLQTTGLAQMGHFTTVSGIGFSQGQILFMERVDLLIEGIKVPVIDYHIVS